MSRELLKPDPIPSHEKPLKDSRTIFLSDHQLSSIMRFSGYTQEQKKLIPYVGLGGILTEEEENILKNAYSSSKSGDQVKPYQEDILLQLMHETKDKRLSAILKKIRKYIGVEIVTIDDIKSPKAFERLPLSSQFIVSQMKTDFFRNAQEEMEKGTVIAISRFKKPSPHYLKAIEETKGESTVEKVTIALENNDEALKSVSHEFINVQLIPVHNGTDSSNVIHQQTKTLNLRVDKNFEDDYAEAILMKTMLTKEMKGTLYGMVSVAACMPLLHMLNENYHDNPLAQTLINFIPPFIADLVTFWGQLSPWLEGDTFSEKSRDFAKRLLSGSHRRSFATSILTTAAGSAGAELVNSKYGPVPGSLVYGGVPFFVAAMTTHDTVRALQKRTGKSYLQTAQMMFANNPAHLGIDIGAAVTFPSAVLGLGVAGQMNNPTAKALIEGVEEHAIASTITMLQLYIGQTYNLKKRMEREVKNWTSKGLIPQSSS